MSRRADRRRPAQIEKDLMGIHYPARKEDILRCARDNDAPGEVTDVLKDMPDRDCADAVGFAKGVRRAELGEVG